MCSKNHFSLRGGMGARSHGREAVLTALMTFFLVGRAYDGSLYEGWYGLCLPFILLASIVASGHPKLPRRVWKTVLGAGPSGGYFCTAGWKVSRAC